MYRYETHLHTFPVSACAHDSVRDALISYKEMGYQGVFITNHFIDGNLNIEARSLPYPERIAYYFSACEEGAELGKEIGVSIKCQKEEIFDMMHRI